MLFLLSACLLPFGLVRPTRGVSGLERGIASLAATSGIVQIDVENVRGKSGFRLDHAALLAATAQWTANYNLHGRVVLVVDHGDAHQGMYLRRHGMAVVFAGRRQKADDVLARDVGYFSAVQRRDSIVVTADGGLRQRCRTKAHSARRLHLVQPTRFLESLVAAADGVFADAAGGAGAVALSLEEAGLASELAKLVVRLEQCTSTGKRAKVERRMAKVRARPGIRGYPTAIMTCTNFPSDHASDCHPSHPSDDQ